MNKQFVRQLCSYHRRDRLILCIDRVSGVIDASDLGGRYLWGTSRSSAARLNWFVDVRCSRIQRSNLLGWMRLWPGLWVVTKHGSLTELKRHSSRVKFVFPTDDDNFVGTVGLHSPQYIHDLSLI